MAKQLRKRKAVNYKETDDYYINGKKSPPVVVKSEPDSPSRVIPDVLYAEDGSVFYPCKNCCRAFSNKDDMEKHDEVCASGGRSTPSPFSKSPASNKENDDEGNNNEPQNTPKRKKKQELNNNKTKMSANRKSHKSAGEATNVITTGSASENIYTLNENMRTSVLKIIKEALKNSPMTLESDENNAIILKTKPTDKLPSIKITSKNLNANCVEVKTVMMDRTASEVIPDVNEIVDSIFKTNKNTSKNKTSLMDEITGELIAGDSSKRHNANCVEVTTVKMDESASETIPDGAEVVNSIYKLRKKEPSSKKNTSKSLNAKCVEVKKAKKNGADCKVIPDVTEIMDSIFGSSKNEADSEEVIEPETKTIKSSPKSVTRTVTENVEEQDMGEIVIDDDEVEGTIVLEDLDIHICKQCGTVFHSLDDLVNHDKYEHRNVKKKYPPNELEKFNALYKAAEDKKCPICSKVIVSKQAWPRHLQTHSDVLKFQCRICKRKFTRNDHRKLHEKRHIVNTEFL
ncbi:PREDICTED: cell wall integrity transcriptional regulator CAS5-like [Nicrophorus vespilloides]|uniref:Cell wall integrity transcriptional regulator CAS5-like n=1 Tax=Nicrophorus vespilloides TaxID=110193 RepID=A0ABM1NA39_NICVS|nr:PREDICTED: cell wall integrity transcriptional regulator CAS5-like [Nicrophorus vespilloides]